MAVDDQEVVRDGVFYRTVRVCECIETAGLPVDQHGAPRDIDVTMAQFRLSPGRTGTLLAPSREARRWNFRPDLAFAYVNQHAVTWQEEEEPRWAPLTNRSS